MKSGSSSRWSLSGSWRSKKQPKTQAVSPQVPGSAQETIQPEDEQDQRPALTGVATQDEAQASTASSTHAHDVASGDPHHESSVTNSQDLWTRAFERLRTEDPDLTVEYDAYLINNYKGKGNKDKLPLQKAAIQSVVDQLVENRARRQWGFSLLGTDIVIRSQAEKIIKFLLWSDNLVKAALTTQPYAALAWSGASMLLPLLQAAMGKHEALLNGFVAINNIQLYWRIAEETHIKTLRGPYREELVTAIVDLYKEILKYQARSICHLSKPSISRAWSTDEGWTAQADLIRTLSDRHRAVLPILDNQRIQEAWMSELRMMNESVTTLKEIRDKLDEEMRHAQQRYQKQDEKELLQALASNYQVHKDFNKERLAGTCQWLLKDTGFRSWTEEETGGLFLVLAGPGCGKSVLSRSLIDEGLLSTRVTTSHVCYFFFKDGIEDRDDSASAVAALLHQLFSLDSTGKLIEYGISSHKRLGDKLKSNFSELWNIFLRCVRCSEAGEVICVLDALDECRKNRRQLITELKKLYGKIPSARSHSGDGATKLKFLITSRPYDSIDPILGVSTVAVADQNQGDIREEINIVIDDRVDMLSGKLTVEAREKLATRLKSFENRTYLWLALIFDIIEGKRSLYSKLSSIENLLDELPLEVSDAYEMILAQSSDETQTKVLLELVLASSRPLTLNEINVALTLALKEPSRFDTHRSMKADLWVPEAVKSIVENLCGLFISVYDSKLYLIHQTARDFLMDSSKGGKWKGCLNLGQSHRTLARSCLHYLLLIEPQTYNTLIEATLLEPFDYEEYAFSIYASVHWPEHFMKCSPMDETTLASARDLCRANDPRVQYWLKVHHDALTPTRGSWWNKCTDLCVASHFGLTSVMEQMIAKEQDTDVNELSSFFGTSIQAAASIGWSDAVRLLLQNGADPNIQGGQLLTPLRAATYCGSLEIVEMLLSGKDGLRADPNVKDGFYGTAFDAALKKGEMEIAETILNCAGDTIIVSEDTLLLALDGQKRIEALTFILDRWPDIVVLTEDVIKKAISWQDSDFSVLKFLLDNWMETLQTSDSLMELVFESTNLELTQRIITAKNVQISQNLANAAAGNFGYAIELLEWLFRDHGDEFQVTEELLEEAVFNFECGFEVLVVLREKRADEFRFTKAMARLAKMNVVCGKRILAEFQ